MQVNQLLFKGVYSEIRGDSRVYLRLKKHYSPSQGRMIGGRRGQRKGRYNYGRCYMNQAAVEVSAPHHTYLTA